MNENSNRGRQPLSIGSKVKVNCYHGTVKQIITALDSKDPFQGEVHPMRLLNPLYEIELDLSRKFSWNEKRVHIPPGCKRMKLFADEFQVVQELTPMRKAS